MIFPATIKSYCQLKEESSRYICPEKSPSDEEVSRRKWPLRSAIPRTARARFPRDNKLAYGGSDHGNDHGERLTELIPRGIRNP